MLIVLAGSITLARMCFSMYCYLYNTQTGCLRLLQELTFNKKKEWKIGQVWTCWERFTYPIFYPFAFSRVRIFVHQIEFLVVSQVGYFSIYIYSWSIIHNLEHKKRILKSSIHKLKVLQNVFKTKKNKA